MQKDQDQKYILNHIIDDDDLPTATSIKNKKAYEKDIALSAPPIFFNLGYRLEEDFFDEIIKPWQSSNYLNVEKGSAADKEQQLCSEFDSFPLNSMRKLSLQNQGYMGGQMINVPDISYELQCLSPQEEVLNNIKHIGKWARDQYGSRTVQIALDSGSDYLRNQIFQQIFIQCSELMRDKFGNYVVQKFFQIGENKHKDLLFQNVKKQFLFLSLHSFGCRVVQKSIEYASQIQSSALQTEIMKLIEPHSMQIILSQNGNHVIQKCFEVSRSDSCKPILKTIILNLEKLSIHPYGCRVVQKYLECGKDQLIYHQILGKLMKMAIQLSQCQFGNYIMQYIVANCKQIQVQIRKIFQQNFIILSCNKFASNVIEKIIKSSSHQFKDKLVGLLLQNGEFITLANNQFGNYVIQSLLEKCSKDYRVLLKNKLKDNCQEMNKTSYGRHVLMQLNKYK